MPGDDELSVDFGKVGDWFKRKKKPETSTAKAPVAEEPKPEPLPTASEKTEEDITIDFRKVLGWFKSDEKPAKTEAHHSSKEKDDEISIDFKKFTGWFKKTSEEDAKASKEDEIHFDLRGIIKWVKAHPVLILIVLLLIMQFVPNKAAVFGKDWYLPWGGMHMRQLGEDLPQADGWATNHVYGLMKGQISGQINQQYPNLPDDRKNKIIEEEWQKVYAAEGPQIEAQVESVKQQLKSFWKYDANGRQYTYMPDIDPYYYLRYARNYVEKGHIEDEIRDGKQIDNHMIAPLGTGLPIMLQPYVMAWQYWILRIFSPKITLMQAATYFPIIFVLLTLIPAFLLGRRFAGNVGGIVSATMIAIMPAILSRTTWGHADTDTWNVFFPVLLTYLYVMLIDSKSWKRILSWGVAAGLATGIYARAWPGGWWYVFDFLLVAFGILVLSELWRARGSITKLKETFKHYFIVGAAYFVSSAVFVTLTNSFRGFYSTIVSPFHFTVIKVAAHVNLWPNVYTTVAELNPVDINNIINSIGGWMFFWIAVAGIALLLFQRKEGSWKIDLRYAPLFALWFIATIYASTKGVRFTLLLAPAFAITFGIAIGEFYKLIVRFASGNFNFPKKVTHVILILAVAILLSSQARSAYGTARNDIPIMNDAWWNALSAINAESQPDAIINSWWDFGHHFKYVADRAVTFDGASQNTPMAHWIGRALTTSDETEAIGILRMLDCGSNKAFETINEQFNDPVKSSRIVKQIIIVDRKEALAILASEGVDDQTKVLEYTHCNPPENYFIASSDMIGKSGVWSHFGLWDFERAMLWRELRNQPMSQAVQYMVDEWDYTKDHAEKIYLEVQAIANENDANSWISPWLGILGGASACNVHEENDKIIVCGNGVRHNISNGQTIITNDQGASTPPAMVMITEKGFDETQYNNSNIGAGVLLYQNSPTEYQSVLASPQMLKSMFVRMYFLQGHGLKHFKEFNRQQLLTGGEVIVYKVDWKGGEQKIYSGLLNLEEQEEIAEGAAKEGDTVSVYYIGSLLDGTIFDSSIQDWKDKNITIDSSFDDYELKPALTFTVGSGQVIEGFDAAVLGMSPDDEQIVQIPPNAAYGFDPEAHALGNKTLRFKIQLVSIE